MLPGTIREHFLLAPNDIYLNHGSFGATPRAVFETYQHYQRQLEEQPCRFLQRELPRLMADARAALADFVGCQADEVVFVPNPTFAANTIARSLRLGPGDELLTTDHEYGACRFAFRAASLEKRFSIVEHRIRLPAVSAQTIVDDFWRSVNTTTKAIFLSHVTAPTALTLPVKAICQRARDVGILTFVDGAHVPGQLDLDLNDVGADFYTGACHKWLGAPKGASFLFARRCRQHLVRPLVVGWGWGDERTFHVGTDFLDNHEWTGTHDPAAYLSVPAAIQFQYDINWAKIRKRCIALVHETTDRAATISGLAPICEPEFHAQMGMIELSDDTKPEALKHRLYDRYRIEIPVFAWNNRKFARVSVQGYNSRDDIDALLKALAAESALRR